MKRKLGCIAPIDDIGPFIRYGNAEHRHQEREPSAPCPDRREHDRNENHGRQHALSEIAPRRGCGANYVKTAPQADLATSPPKRRSRVIYSEIARSRVSRVKSGQCSSTNTNSV